MSWWRRRRIELPLAKGPRMVHTHVAGPVVHCKGSGKRGFVDYDHPGWVQCKRCRYAVQYGWGEIMQEHEREARPWEREWVL